MVENCSHNCEGCTENCSERTKESFLEKPNEMSHIKKVIGVVSGKGGVGKSLVTSLLAVLAQRKGYKTAIMDADITGPSIPRAFGLHGHAEASEWGLFPVKTAAGTSVMSLNLLMKNETDPVVWRGPLISGGLFSEIRFDAEFFYAAACSSTGSGPFGAFQLLHDLCLVRPLKVPLGKRLVCGSRGELEHCAV